MKTLEVVILLFVETNTCYDETKTYKTNLRETNTSFTSKVQPYLPAVGMSMSSISSGIRLNMTMLTFPS
jgi:hypothetical protein